MTKPLALLVYDNSLTGSQLVNRLQDLGYRVKALSNTANLVEQIQAEKPLVMIIDIVAGQTDMIAAITAVRHEPATAHLPILAIGDHRLSAQQIAARDAGANLVASETGFLSQLPQLLEQVLSVD